MVKKLQTQNSETTPATSKSADLNAIGSIVFKLALLGILGAGVWHIYQNPQILNFSAQNKNVTLLEQKINLLETRLNSLEQSNHNAVSAQDVDTLRLQTAQLAADIHKKVEKISDINTEILGSKASNASMLGVISRVDDLESKVKSLGKVSSQGALILTAAGLVKDAAESGQPFVYEAEVLRQLAAGTNMQPAAETIAAYADDGIKSKEWLIEQFDRLYDAQEAAKQPVSEEVQPEKEAEPAAGWKEKLNSKLSKLVVIEYHNENSAESSPAEDEVYKLVNRGELKQAMTLMADNPEYRTDAFDTWKKQVAAEENISRAIKQIQALTLAVMKAENLKNGNQ